MLVSLLAGLAPTLSENEDEETDERGSVILRREQVKRVLFQGKAGIVEHDVIFGSLLFLGLIRLRVDVFVSRRRRSCSARLSRSNHRQRHARRS